MLWLYICVFRIGTVASREAGGKGSKEIKMGGSGVFLAERIVDLGRELMCIFKIKQITRNMVSLSPRLL